MVSMISVTITASSITKSRSRQAFRTILMASAAPGLKRGAFVFPPFSSVGFCTTIIATREIRFFSLEYLPMEKTWFGQFTTVQTGGTRSHARLPQLRFAVNNAIAKVTDLPLPKYVHCAASIADDAIIGPGAVIMEGAIIESGAIIGRNAFVGPHSEIGMMSRIGAGTRLGENCIVRAFSEIGNNVNIAEMNTIGSYAQIGDNVRVAEDNILGPFAHVGSQAEIGAGNRLGSYVRLGELSQIGAANYVDAQFKLGANAKLGSSNQMDWSVSVGNGSSVGNQNWLGARTTVINSNVGDNNITRMWTKIDGIKNFGEFLGDERRFNKLRSTIAKI
ncbi:MAG TPA: hypothetical protein V6C81_30740 [Planktothrix sp.]|jgi:UDP-3-O-[3-hydroxymyristoyl] glucosamine N-acyltransferase